MAGGTMEYTPILHSTQHSPQYKLYFRRWYILFIFSLLSLNQSNLWITYGAVGDTTKDMYKVSGAWVNFLTATGPIGFIPLSFVTSWAIGEYGLRVACVIGAVLCTAGAILRCFATESSYWIVILAQLLNAASGPVVMNAPPALSATWFGVNERTFATAVGTIANSVGSATGFLLGLLIHNPHQLQRMLYYEAAFSIGLLFLMLVYFPSHPPSPPTATSSLKKEGDASLWKSFVVMLKESWRVVTTRDGVLILLSAGISSGATGGWGAMLVLILANYYNQWYVQWLGLFNILGSVVGGLVLGKVHDHYRHFKILMGGFFLIATGVFVAFSLATTRIIKIPFSAIMALNIAAGVTLGGISPVAYEALVEVTYPVKEENSAGLLSLTNNFACLALLIVGDYKTGNFINWAMAGICLTCLLLISFTREKYLRTSIDLK